MGGVAIIVAVTALPTGILQASSYPDGALPHLMGVPVVVPSS